MQLYNLLTDFSIVVFWDIATGKRRTIGYFTWKQLSPWAMEVCNPSTAILRQRIGIPFPKAEFFHQKKLLRRRQCAWEAWGAVVAVSYPPTFIFPSWSTRIPGTSSSDDSLDDCTLAVKCRKKSVGFLALQGFQLRFLYVFVSECFCAMLCLLKRCHFWMMSLADRVSNRRPLKIPSLRAIGPPALVILWSFVLPSHVSSSRMPMNQWRGRDFLQNAARLKCTKRIWNWHEHGATLEFPAGISQHPAAGGYMSQFAVNNPQDHLGANRSRRSIGCCNSCESQAGTPFKLTIWTPFRLTRLKDKPPKLCCHLLVTSPKFPDSLEL